MDRISTEATKQSHHIENKQRLLTTSIKLHIPSLEAEMDGREYRTLVHVIYYLFLQNIREEPNEL